MSEGKRGPFPLKIPRKGPNGSRSPRRCRGANTRSSFILKWQPSRWDNSAKRRSSCGALHPKSVYPRYARAGARGQGNISLAKASIRVWDAAVSRHSTHLHGRLSRSGVGTRFEDDDVLEDHMADVTNQSNLPRTRSATKARAADWISGRINADKRTPYHLERSPRTNEGADVFRWCTQHVHHIGVESLLGGRKRHDFRTRFTNVVTTEVNVTGPVAQSAVSQVG